MALTNVESNNLIKSLRKSNEERGKLSFDCHFQFDLTFAIKEGVLYWKRSKQGIILRDMQMIPGYDIITTYIKSYYEHPSEIRNDTTNDQISSNIITRVNEALTEGHQYKEIQKAYKEAGVINESKVSIYNEYLNHLLFENASSANDNIGKIVKNIKFPNNPNKLREDPNHDFYYLICQYNEDADTYNALLIYYNNKFYKIKETDIKSENIDFSTADEAEEEFNNILNNSTNKFFNNFSVFKIRATSDFNSIDQETKGEVAIQKEKFKINEEDFETDDIYQGKQPENFPAIFNIKKPLVIKITTDNLSFKKTFELKDIYFQNGNNDIDEKHIIYLTISGRELAEGMIQQLEAKQTRISLNGTFLKTKSGKCFLDKLMPNIEFLFILGKSNGNKALRKRFNNSWNPKSEYNEEVAKRT